MEILWLDELYKSKYRNIGSKALLQSILSSKGTKVPVGFYLGGDLVSDLIYRQNKKHIIKKLEKVFNELIQLSTEKTFIVRSCSNDEDVEGHLYPGIFKSISNIVTFDDLLDGINECYKSAFDEVVYDYKDAIGSDNKDIQMSILIQEQIKGEIIGQSKIELFEGGDRIYCEAVKYSNFEMLNQSSPEYGLVAEYHNDSYSTPTYKGSSNLKSITDSIQSDLDNIREACKFPVLIEWISKNDIVYIVQVRSFPASAAPEIDRYNSLTKNLPRFGYLGLKSSAMQYFKSSGWFDPELALFSPDLSLDDIEKKMADFPSNERGITVRFSYKGNLGLPRKFCKSKQEAIGFIKRLWNGKWSCIVHTYMTITNSFELWIDDNDYILEHLPGLWESDSKSPPDCIHDFNDELSISLSKSSRDIIDESVGGIRSKISIPPIRRETADSWVKQIAPYLVKIRSDFKESLPLNFHFVEDEDGKWNFLNIRIAGEIENFSGGVYSLFSINTYDDFKKWNRKDNLLIRMTPDRGDEINLSKIKKYVPVGTLLFVEFGVLSHPAMVLRELGYKVKRFISSDF
ncbi:PEP/pyruvate-binding domain-containing protein [Neptunomonas concharum]|uniref:Pyruvate phosphate dikinase AMP/ATP-binding domain-containing protein n=1 Tax=Neptunomonas concharum TaxID=1031538 RepID=A0A5P1RA43_9GAMM|nr:PEP/pyruvate-binding domain-containing protein [Neptunomonas concharum]QEQ96524.1 hypothetical protein F0U83_07280 [Neptunomonas concharum]